VCRLYRDQSLQLRNKSPKRRVKAKLREDRSPATEANQVWATDFVHDQLFDGRKIRALTVLDTFTRLSPAIEVRRSWRGSDVVATLDRAAAKVGCPKAIRLDNGPEFISKELDLWAFMHDVTLDFSRPGKPTDNAFIESFNGKFRGECLNTNWFLSLDEATRKCEAWRRDYNEVRPHSAIDNQVPAALHRMADNPGQPAAR
jgi:putative transposase